MSPAAQGLLRRLFSTDHKTVGRQFLFTTLLFALLGGGMAMVLRAQLGWPGISLPGLGVIDASTYNAVFTMHASLMIFFVVIPVLTGGFGNFLLPLMIGARKMAFPLLTALSYWLLWPAFLCVFAGLFVSGGGAGTGWTAYVPLSVFQAGSAQTLWAIGISISGVASILGAVNAIATVVRHRAPGLTYFRLPMTVWALSVTAVLTLLATPVLLAALGMLVAERTLHTSFFLPAGAALSGHAAGQPLLWQHLFWFYSHPAVYIMILPAMGFVSDILPAFARKPLFGYRPMVYATVAIAGLGFTVWGHHMFQSGMSPYLGEAFMVSTMLIALPSGVKVFNWLATLWRGRIHFDTPMLFALGFVGMFIVGGLSGIFLASPPVDSYAHDTYFVVAHIHYVLFAGSLMGIFAAFHYWFPKIFGRNLDERLGSWHFWLTFFFMNATFLPMHYLGLQGMQRRIANPDLFPNLRPLQPLNTAISISAFALFVVQGIFFFNVFKSLRSGERAGKNPWRANGLEWEAESPPPPGNFETLPAVHRGPYEYSSPGSEEDYLPQARLLEAGA